MDKITGAIKSAIRAWQSRFTAASTKGKIGLGCITLLALWCACSVPLAIIMPDPEPELEPAASESRSQEIALGEGEEQDDPTEEPVKEPTQEPQAMYTDQPTYTPEPTHTALPTHTPLPTSTPLPTNTPLPTATTRPTNTPRPTETNTPIPPTDPPPTATPEGEQTARAVSIVDGDTFDITINGEVDRVRMIGINADEYDQQCGQESATALGNLILGKDVRLVKDISERDTFDRLLRYVYVGESFINAEMIRQGYAFALEYPPDVAQAGYLAAQESGAAVPACRNVIPPTAPPAEPAPAATAPPAAEQPAPPAATEPAPAATVPPVVALGNLIITYVNKGDEFVDIRNDSGQDIDLSGWRLVSEKGAQACSLGGVLPAGVALRIWAMAEDAGQGGFNCNFGTNIWHNSEHDPAVLYDPSGAEVARR